MQIGDLSRQAGVNIETIRYYERIGVLPKPARQLNGRRTYSPVDAERLGFIRHARELGFDLPSIRILLALQERPEASCEATCGRFQRRTGFCWQSGKCCFELIVANF